jgi:hypothetical protein
MVRSRHIVRAADIAGAAGGDMTSVLLTEEEIRELEEGLNQNDPFPLSVEERNVFPEVIDNTIRSTWRKCPQQWRRAHSNQLRLRGMGNIHLTAGGAFARGLEVARRAFYETKLSVSESEALGLEALRTPYGPVDFPPTKNGDKSLAGVERAFESYMLEYPLGMDRIKPLISNDGKAAVEFTFAIPIEIKHPVTGNPILYAGRFDMFGLLNDTLFVVDEKTATSLGEQWTRQWDLDSQFTGYCWAAKQFNYPVAGAVVRGIGMLKTKISHAEVIELRPQWQIDRWYIQLLRDVKAMIAAWKEGYFDFALDKSACDAYGGCQFKLLCSSNEPRQWLADYENHVWDPLVKL